MGASSDPAGSPAFLRDLPLARRAYSFAREAHRGQRRESDAAQFIIHPLEVAALLNATGHRDRVVATGILHDAIENSAATTHDIDTLCGSEISQIVAAMTESFSGGSRMFSFLRGRAPARVGSRRRVPRRP